MKNCIRGCLLFAAVALCAGPAAASSQSAAEGLDAVCARLTAADNPFFGRGTLEALDAQLRQSSDPRLLIDRAAARLRLGELIPALQDLEKAIPELGLTAGANAAPPLRDPPETEDPNSRRALAQQAAWLAGITALQLGEDANCLHDASADACIVPLRKGALHRDATWARQAAAQFAEVVQAQPRDPLAIWLLNLATALSGDSIETLAPVLRIPVFLALLPEGSEQPDEGSRWLNRPLALPEPNPADLAGGAVMDDFDGDGFLDLVTSTWDPCAGMQALRNRGDGTFEDVSTAWNLDRQLGGLNVMQTDYDNDGVLDLLVLRGAWLLGDGAIRNSLLRGLRSPDGEFTFQDITVDVGLADPPRPTQAASWADVDGDGDLDLYLGNEATAADPHPSQLLLNHLLPDGSRNFEDVTEVAGAANLRYAKGVAFGDYDNDGDPDLYVSNFGLNRLYRNEGKGTDGVPRFTDVAQELGVVEPRLQSFATWWFDFDHDGDLDLFVADYRSQAREIAASYRSERAAAASTEGQPLLYRNLLRETGTAGFREVSREVGLTRPAMPMGANYSDFDNDGWLDILLGTGEPDLASVLPNQAWQNRSGQFRDITFVSGLGHLQKGHGIAFGDVDHDGDQDLLHQLGGFYPVDRYPNALFENPTLSPRGAGAVAVERSRWVTLELVGVQANRFALGARVRVTVSRSDGELQTFHHLVGSGGSFGASSLRLEIGLGSATSIDQVEIQWPGSVKVQKFVAGSDESALPLDAFVRIVQGKQAFEVLDRPSFALRTQREDGVPETHPAAPEEHRHVHREPVRRGPMDPRSDRERGELR